MTVLTLNVLSNNLITDALSRESMVDMGSGNWEASSVKISASLPRRLRAASRDFSFLFSEFLQVADTKIQCQAQITHHDHVE